MPTRLPVLLALAAVLGLAAAAAAPQATAYDLVIAGGRVIDPETHLDAVRDVAIVAGTIRSVGAAPLAGQEHIDARGLIVAPHTKRVEGGEPGSGREPQNVR